MTKRILLLLFLAMTWELNILSQDVSPRVLAPAAGQAVHNNINFSQTIGQTAVDIIGSGGYVLTQGFQQPLITNQEDTSSKGNGVEIINITGTVIKSMKINFVTDYYHIEQIMVSDIKIGLYFVRVSSDDKLILRTFKIEKL